MVYARCFFLSIPLCLISWAGRRGTRVGHALLDVVALVNTLLVAVVVRCSLCRKFILFRPRLFDKNAVTPSVTTDLASARLCVRNTTPSSARCPPLPPRSTSHGRAWIIYVTMAGQIYRSPISHEGRYADRSAVRYDD